jgi:phosphoribosylglycinamide formyltransferase-1
MAHGLPATRTSCFLVDGSRDGGAVLCMGPPVPVDGRTATREGAREQELIQKARSDRPCLEWTVRAFAAGRLAVSAAVHRDGSRIVLVDGTPTTLGGMRLGDIG